MSADSTYRVNYYEELSALRVENARLREEIARLTNTALEPFSNDCPRCGDGAATKHDTRVWRDARRGVFGWFARPAHFYRRCATCRATWREAPRQLAAGAP